MVHILEQGMWVSKQDTKIKENSLINLRLFFWLTWLPKTAITRYSKEKHMLREINCVSTVSGWQTAFKDTNITFGPSFHKIQDLWDWQRENIYAKEWA
jgi:hypothetical protein